MGWTAVQHGRTAIHCGQTAILQRVDGVDGRPACTDGNPAESRRGGQPSCIYSVDGDGVDGWPSCMVGQACTARCQAPHTRRARQMAEQVGTACHLHACEQAALNLLDERQCETVRLAARSTCMHAMRERPAYTPCTSNPGCGEARAACCRASRASHARPV